jgi:hypothetical protein
MRLHVGLYTNTKDLDPLNEEVGPVRAGDRDHEEVTYRVRSGEALHIPQAERYSTKDWLHNILTLPSSRLLKRIRGIVLFNFVISVLAVIANHTLKFNV